METPALRIEVRSICRGSSVGRGTEVICAIFRNFWIRNSLFSQWSKFSNLVLSMSPRTAAFQMSLNMNKHMQFKRSYGSLALDHNLDILFRRSTWRDRRSSKHRARTEVDQRCNGSRSERNHESNMSALRGGARRYVKLNKEAPRARLFATVFTAPQISPR